MIPADLLDAWTEDMLCRRLYGPRVAPGDIIRAPEGTNYTVVWVRGLSVRLRRQGARSSRKGRPASAVTIPLAEAMRRMK